MEDCDLHKKKKKINKKKIKKKIKAVTRSTESRYDIK